MGAVNNFDVFVQMVVLCASSEEFLGEFFCGLFHADVSYGVVGSAEFAGKVHCHGNSAFTVFAADEVDCSVLEPAVDGCF